MLQVILRSEATAFWTERDDRSDNVAAVATGNLGSILYELTVALWAQRARGRGLPGYLCLPVTLLINSLVVVV